MTEEPLYWEKMEELYLEVYKISGVVTVEAREYVAGPWVAQVCAIGPCYLSEGYPLEISVTKRLIELYEEYSDGGS